MRNKRLTIFALAVMLISGATGCGEDRGLNPGLVAFVGSWDVASLVFTSVATPGLTEDAFSAAGGVTQQQIFMYDDGTLLTITEYADTLDTATMTMSLPVDNTYDLETYEVYATGDLLSTALFRNRDPGSADPAVNASLIAPVEAACGSVAVINADGDATSPCDVIVLNLDETDQIVFTFTQDGDDATITGTDMYDFGTGDEAATFILDMDRFIFQDDRGPLV